MIIGDGAEFQACTPTKCFPHAGGRNQRRYNIDLAGDS